MKKQSVVKYSPLVAALALALSAPAAMAALPSVASNQLPGSFSSNNSVTYTASDSTTATITVPSSATILQWGGTTQTNTVAAPPGINAQAGFNVGSAASLTITAATSTSTTFGVLVSDQTGNPSQIYGKLNASGGAAVFVANGNGVVVGSNATVTLPNGGGFIGENVTMGTTGTSAGVITSGTETGAVTINGTVSNSSGFLLIAGNGNVNVGGNLTNASSASVVAGFSFTASSTTVAPLIGSQYVSNSSAVVNLSANGVTAAVNAAGNVNLTGSDIDVTSGQINGALVNNGSATVSATLGGALTNNGDLTLTTTAASGALTNNGTMTLGSLSAASITNSGTMSITTGFNLTATAGKIVNNGSISAGANNATFTAAASSGAGIVNAGTITAGSLTLRASSGDVLNSGTISLTGTTDALTMSAATGNVTLNGSVLIGTSAPSSNSPLTSVSLTASGGNVSLGSNLLYVTSTDLSGDSVTITNGGVIGTGTVTAAAAKGNVGLYQGTTLAGSTVDVSAAGNLVLAGNIGDSSTDTINVTAGNIYAGAHAVGGFNVSSSVDARVALTVAGNVVNQNGVTSAVINYQKAIPINVASSGTVTLAVDPTSAGTAKQYMNLAVNGNVTVSSTTTGPISGGTANGNVIANYPWGGFTLQATGNIATGNFYYPGQLFFANVQQVGGSSFALSNTGTITVDGILSNAVTSNLTGMGGMAFLTNQKLAGVGTVITNTNAWINFPGGSGAYLANYYNAENSTSNRFYGLKYANGSFTTQLAGGTNTANKFNSVTLP